MKKNKTIGEVKITNPATKKRFDFWAASIDKMKVLDRFVYKGHGRPRKTDYCTLQELERKLNQALHTFIDSRGKIPPVGN
jgi:hypothetical protein